MCGMSATSHTASTPSASAPSSAGSTAANTLFRATTTTTTPCCWPGQIGQIRQIVVDGQRLVLCHYGMRTWPGSRRGALHLYGHSHGTLPGNAQCLDVGVDCWDFRPVTLPEIRAKLEREPNVGMVP